MLIYNTTNIPESTIRQIAKIVKPDIPEINSISLRNKKEGMIDGNWGKFYSLDYSITLCVPTHISEYNSGGKYLKNRFTLRDRYEFIALVLAHEYQHAWQFIHHPDWFDDKIRIEKDAEAYEVIGLNYWRDYMIEHPIEIKPAARVNWRDFR